MSFTPHAREHLGRILRARSAWRTVVVVWWVAGAVAPGTTVAQSLPTRAAELLAIAPARLLELAALTRPGPVSDEEKRAALSRLPAEGEVTQFSDASIEKLRSLSTVLRHAQRESTYVIKVVDVRRAAIGNYFRSAILISQPALELLARDELQAVIAHELGHEYVWTEYNDASNRSDANRMRELELVCDAIAVLTLRSAGLDEAALPRGLEKISRFNQTRFGTAVNERSYPTLAERRKLVRALSRALMSEPVINK